jgi:hypothetical protein
MSVRESKLHKWALDNRPTEDADDPMYWEQIMLIRDNIPRVLAKTNEELEFINSNLRALGSHYSWCKTLPVFKVMLPEGTAFILRYNFYNWKTTVISPTDVEADFMGLFDTKEDNRSSQCEGFPDGTVFGPYCNNKRQFTFGLSDHFKLYTFFWIFAHAVRGKQ